MSVEGLYYQPGIVDRDLNELFALWIGESARGWSGVSKSASSRRVLHYGYNYDYITGRITSATPFPEIIQDLAEIASRTAKTLVEADVKFNQCIINEYLPGQGISPHVDLASFGEVIACFTFGSGCDVVFERAREKVVVHVEDRSLYLMTGPARYEWKHSIPSRKSDIVDGKRLPRGVRYSVTFRSYSR